jgi:hypothetical protein
VRKAGKITAICEPTVETMWDPQHHTIPWVSTACYGDSFTFFRYFDRRHATSGPCTEQTAPKRLQVPNGNKTLLGAGTAAHPEILLVLLSPSPQTPE